ncbi:hypothetical protein [Neorhizobium alkalisoli]|uniref:hypothetical protein n=1 Tax=Neorhizobium alkalisoli TaxID=528178 RepID=UPI000CFA0398|nr:hypothetical protein [Neorhizobium alkalisoli]
MKTYLTSGIAALIVSAGFAGAAAAQDMYSNPEGLPQSPPTIQQSRGQDVDTMSTGSIVRYGTSPSWNGSTSGNADLDGGQDEGDYYDGAYRPHN